MFNLAIDSKLRGCDVVAIRVEDVAGGGDTRGWSNCPAKKTGRLSDLIKRADRQAVDDYLKGHWQRPGEFLFTGRRGPNRHMTTRQYAGSSPGGSAASTGPRLFGTHSLRRTKATLIYRRTGI